MLYSSGFFHSCVLAVCYSNENSEVNPETIQDIAMKVLEEQMKASQSDRDIKERTIFFLGSNSVGKSTAINKFFDREDPTLRPTWALEYSYGRRSGQTQHLQKEVLNVWDLGCLQYTRELISTPINCHDIKSFAVVLMLDLSQPHSIWEDFQICYEGLMKAFYQKMSFNDLETLKNQTAARLKMELKEEIFADLVPFPMVIVGGKYDIFQNYDDELKACVVQGLRALTHLLGCALLFYSHQTPKLAKTLRDTISHLGFGSPSNPFRSHITNVDEPVSIWFGTDNWQLINEGSSEPLTMKQIEARFNTLTPNQKLINKKNKHGIVNPTRDFGFKESIIDEMCTQKEIELKSLLHEIQLRGQFQSIK